MSDTAPGSTSHEAIQFLRSSPCREVTSTALAAGIGRTDKKRLAQQLAPAIRAGLLVRRIDDSGFAFWSLGANIDAAVAPEVAIDEKVVVKVSAMATPSIFAYAEQRKAAPFSVALHTDGRLLIERHGRTLLELTNDERLHVVSVAGNGVRP